MKNTDGFANRYELDLTGLSILNLNTSEYNILNWLFIVIHGPDEEDPFVPVDVTKEAKGYYKWINDHIWDLNRMQKQADEVEMEPGDQCSNPYECWYYGYCHGDHS